MQKGLAKVMKLKVGFYFDGGKELSHVVEGEDTTQMITNIQKHKTYNMVKGNTHYVVDTEKASYFYVEEVQ
ncbi:hypothetical protein [Bacillus sp. MUM 13]|uniref:hypothetical protein n=1 Tax=Bacillus sp. MUM 13 TaxID=1678001 RepID=UPI0008F5E985|nr:hypothetical protein [Bacillus sp. MUM 13]OIK08997.1 hypothetical protein BIV59_18130 [Bacillus sp. MUM 13]